MRRRHLVAAVVCTLVPFRSTAAQIPGESIFSGKGNVRAEYLAKSFEEVGKSLRAWSAAVNNQADVKEYQQYIVPDLFFGPMEGWLARGPEALDSLRSYLGRTSGYSITLLDFDASGSMGYVYAAVRYQFKGPAGREYRDVEATVVLLQRGDVWKIRSYIERARPN